MTGYAASVLNDPAVRLLVVAPNWLGDGIMLMPALQVLRDRLHADATLDVLLKPSQAGLWAMHAAPARIHTLVPGNLGPFRTGSDLKGQGFTHTVIIPNSVRTALAPAMAGIPCRRGTAGHHRRWLLSETVDLSSEANRHQQWEMARLLLPGDLPETLPAPRLMPDVAARDQAWSLLGEGPGPRLGLIPGAARGPSKRWPGERFREVAAQFIDITGGTAFWLGMPEDHALCEELGASLPPGRSLNLAGRTKLEVFAALLAGLDAVVANDSGGMHLAAAVDTPVVAVFGVTDPAKTGPLHPQAVVVQHAATRSRAVARDSDAAREALAAVTVPEVVEPVLAILDHAG